MYLIYIFAYVKCIVNTLNKGREVKTLKEQHQNWMDVTAGAVNRRHQTNGYKGPVGAATKQGKRIGGAINETK